MYFSYPAVSQIYAFTTLLSLTLTFFAANSTPMVDLESKLNSSRVNLDNMFVLPAPLSPIGVYKIK